jgi:phosphopantetheinyl transferase (holo-ACP synthase)
MSSILGIGIDVVAIDRFQESLERTPGLLKESSHLTKQN